MEIYFKKIGIKLPYDPTIPLVGRCAEEIIKQTNKQTTKKTQHNVHCSTISKCKIAKTWKQPRCPLTDERIQKSWYIYIEWDNAQTLKGMLSSQF